jgi:hypothetical protein
MGHLYTPKEEMQLEPREAIRISKGVQAYLLRRKARGPLTEQRVQISLRGF